MGKLTKLLPPSSGAPSSSVAILPVVGTRANLATCNGDRHDGFKDFLKVFIFGWFFIFGSFFCSAPKAAADLCYAKLKIKTSALISECRTHLREL